MSSVSMSLPRKMADAQFIGDLMNLFDRRKVKCGDPQTLERFASDLASNHTLRSDLFTLCTAISHMAAEDLSGEQLLMLVARALGGAAVPKGAAVAAIPESMRKAFLSGYEAWSKRGSAMDEPLAWPPTRPTAPRDEALPAMELGEAASEAGVAKGPGDGRRTLQEALEIVRERTPNGLVAPRSAVPGTNIEHLTIGELKKLLEEIEQRVGRIESQASPKASAAGTVGDDAPQNDGVRGPGAARVSEAEVRAAEPAIPLADAVRAPRAAILPFESASRSGLPDGTFDEAFVARHPYLKPRVRVTRGSDAAAVSGVAGRPAPTAARAAAIAPATPLAGPVRIPEPAAPVLNKADAVASAAAAGAASAVAPTAAPPVSHARFEPIPFYETQCEPLSPPMRLSLRALAVLASLILVFVVSAGVLVYQSFHPKTIYDYPDLRPSDAGSGQSPGTARGAGSDAQVIVAASDDSLMTLNSPEGTRAGTNGASRSKAHGMSEPGPPALVWPASNREASIDAGAAPSFASPARRGDAAAAHRSAPAGGVLRVPSTTMIGYALSTPKATYPAGQPKGMSGTVVVAVAISREGSVTGAWAVRGPDELRSAAVQAVQAWRFRPYLVDGSPVEVRTTLGFFFKGQ